MRGILVGLLVFCAVVAMASCASAQGSWGGYGSSGNGPNVSYESNWGGYATPSTTVVYSAPANYGSWGGTYSAPDLHVTHHEPRRLRWAARGVRLRIAVPVRQTRLAVHYHGSSG